MFADCRSQEDIRRLHFCGGQKEERRTVPLYASRFCPWNASLECTAVEELKGLWADVEVDNKLLAPLWMETAETRIAAWMLELIKSLKTMIIEERESCLVIKFLVVWLRTVGWKQGVDEQGWFYKGGVQVRDGSGNLSWRERASKDLFGIWQKNSECFPTQIEKFACRLWLGLEKSMSRKRLTLGEIVAGNARYDVEIPQSQSFTLLWEFRYLVIKYYYCWLVNITFITWKIYIGSTVDIIFLRSILKPNASCPLFVSGLWFHL